MDQLVMSFADGAPRFAVKQNPAGRSPLGFEDPKDGVYVPRLGAQDLVRFGAFAETVGLRIEAFYIADFSLRRLSAEDEAQVSGEILAMLREHGVESALDSLDTELDHYVVIGVRIVDARLRTAPLWRHGVYASDGDSQLPEILSHAWVKLKLS